MSSTKKVRAGVAGIGAMGKNHARIYSELESSELTAIFDLNKDLANGLASQYGGKVVDSMEEFISFVTLGYCFFSEFRSQLYLTCE